VQIRIRFEKGKEVGKTVDHNSLWSWIDGQQEVVERPIPVSQTGKGKGHSELWKQFHQTKPERRVRSAFSQIQ